MRAPRDHHRDQAQARVHRIGQKKSVKIYRLITAKTYEQHMFHRASGADAGEGKSASNDKLSPEDVRGMAACGHRGGGGVVSAVRVCIDNETGLVVVFGGGRRLCLRCHPSQRGCACMGSRLCPMGR